MIRPLTSKYSLNDLRAARKNGTKVPMLTCYDYSTARLMQESGVPMLLVGDSAANVIFGHDTTLPVSLNLMMELAAAVRRGAPLAFVVADMPFGSYHGSVAKGVKNVCRMVQLSRCDCVKVEVAASHGRLVRELADAGVAVMAHVGLRPQAVGILGGYKSQGRTAESAEEIVELAMKMERAGAAAVLLEAVPPEVSQRVVEQVVIPVIGCGAGPACDGHVIVTHDGLGLTTHRPRFVPELGDVATKMKEAFGNYVERIASGDYPAPEHQYQMPADEKAKFLASTEF
ncbi:MAG TPA: 3-methyl-2-oxobutanoate hydroxymethyltransferase [Tepidisphaeraceae bacterium]|nr:3-methyl-2-oxobutanoate hydroxymethyltransferase [Tepidisphaeraceae bacterium]